MSHSKQKCLAALPSKRPYRYFGTCQYIEGDPAEGAEKCGRETVPYSPWCSEHHELCHRSPEDSEKIRRLTGVKV